MHRRIALLLISSLLTGCSYFHNLPPEHRRAVLVSFDGGGEQVMDHLIADGAMPNLARLRAEGVQAAYSRTNFPSKTAAGHAALWTGAYGDTNGITGNRVFKLPLAEHTILELNDGFDSQELLAEPIWVTAARAGRRAVVLQATHIAPLTTYAPGGRFGGPYAGSMTLMDGYAGVVGKEAVMRLDASTWPANTEPVSGRTPGHFPREGSLSTPEGSILATVEDSPWDPVNGYDTLALSLGRGQAPFARLKPGHDAASWSAPVQVGTGKAKGWCTFHLVSLTPDAHELLLYRSPVVVEQTNKPAAAEAFYGPWPFLPQGAIDVWARGDFGPTLFHGGDGTAEARYLDTVDYVLDEARHRTELLMQRRDWDLAVSYLPFPDEALHAWYGIVDTNSPSYDAALAPRVWKLLDRVGAACDRYIGALRDPDTVVAVASDHGFAGLKWRFFPNNVLKQAGLLTVGADGKIDLAHTRAMYTGTDGAFIEVNSVRHKGGIVPLSEVPAVLDQVETALRAVKAEDGTPLVTEFLRPAAGAPAASEDGRTNGGTGSDPLGVGGIRGGDLYLDLHPGYYYSPDWSKPGFTAPFEPGQGGHVFDPRREDMHAAFSLVGPGVKHGLKIGAVRNIDVAPTVTRLLGLPKPANATGRVLEEALTN